LLQAEVSFKSIKAFVGFLGDRLADKPVKVKVKVGDKETEIEAKSRQELAELEKTALNLIAAMGGEKGA
jgi:glucose-6-phosphate dehydrogenase assembly protein OpcA